MSSIAFKTLGGEGEDIVLIHGFGSDRLSWLGNSPALMTIGRVHALDLPGHGESDAEVADGSAGKLAEIVADLLIKQGLVRFHLIGHSLGGAIALILAARQPKIVSSLTLIAPAGIGRGVDQSFAADYAALDDLEAALTLMRRLVVRPQLINKMTAQRVLAQLGRDGVRDAVRRIGAALPESERQAQSAALAVAVSDIPRSIIWGQQDAINALDDKRLQSFGGDAHVIPDTGHLPHIEDAKRVNGLLLEFLAPLLPS